MEREREGIHFFYCFVVLSASASISSVLLCFHVMPPLRSHQSLNQENGMMCGGGSQHLNQPASCNILTLYFLLSCVEILLQKDASKASAGASRATVQDEIILDLTV